MTDTNAPVTIVHVTPPLADLRKLREARGWSRETLAEKSGTSAMTILRAELHGSDPSLSTLTAWADALDVPLDELVDRAGDAA